MSMTIEYGIIVAIMVPMPSFLSYFMAKARISPK